RPISFQMDLYQPLYVPRPVVEPELFASLRPPTYSGLMDAAGGVDSPDEAMLDRAEALGAIAGKPAVKRQKESVKKANAEKDMAHFAPQSLAGSVAKMEDAKAAVNYYGLARSAVASAATAANLGDFFQYVIDHPVSLPRQKSAMLPIVSTDVEGAKVSIYNERTLAKHPLLGLRLKNTTGVHLMQGPITVFDKNTYSGDSRIMDLQKG